MNNIVLLSFLVLSVEFVYGSNRNRSIKHFILDCLENDFRFSCYAEKAAMLMENTMNQDVPIFEGVTFIRNKIKVNSSKAKKLFGLKRLTKALTNFWQTHSLTFDFSKIEEREEPRDKKQPVIVMPVSGGSGVHYMEYGSEDDHGSYGMSGIMDKIKKGLKKQKAPSYMKSTFLVLLGIFGLTVPFTLKTLAVIAGKALLASNAAMLIVAGVALRKIFEHQEPTYEEGPTIKVHTAPTYETMPDEEVHERMGYGYNYMTYAPYYPAYSYENDHRRYRK